MQFLVKLHREYVRKSPTLQPFDGIDDIQTFCLIQLSSCRDVVAKESGNVIERCRSLRLIGDFVSHSKDRTVE